MELMNFSSTIKIGELQKINPMVDRVKIYVGTDGYNVKKFDILKEAYDYAMNSLRGTRIRGYYLKEDKIFMGHKNDPVRTRHGLKRTPEPITYGFVDPYQDPEWEKVMEDGVEKDYVVCYGYIWSGIFPELGKLDYKSLGQSMEIKVIKGEKKADRYTVEKFDYAGLCLLEGVKPTFKNARVELFSDAGDPEIQVFSDISQEDFIEKFSEVMQKIDDLTKQLTANYSDDDNEKLTEEQEVIESFATYTVEVSTNGDEAIDGTVGEKDIGDIKKKVLESSNSKSVIKKIFARYPNKITEELIQSDLGYPLMSERDGKFYYNTGFIKAASSRIEQNKDEPYYKKVKTNIEKARKAVNMPENFSKKGVEFSVEMNKEMLMKFAMQMQNYAMGRYMPYAYDDKMMYAMDMEDDKAMAIPYAMKDDMPTMDMEKMAYDMETMAYDMKEYENMMRAMNTLMMMYKEKYAMAEEGMGVMEKYSVAETELGEAKKAVTDKEKAYIDLHEKFSVAEAKVAELEKDLTSIKQENLEFSQAKTKTECLELLTKNQKHIADSQYEKFSKSIDENEYETFSAFEGEIIKSVYEKIHNTEGGEANFSATDEIPDGEVNNMQPIIGFSDKDEKKYDNDWDKLRDKYKEENNK